MIILTRDIVHRRFFVDETVPFNNHIYLKLIRSFVSILFVLQTIEHQLKKKHGYITILTKKPANLKTIQVLFQ